MIPQSNHQYNTRPIEDVTTFYCRTDVFKYSYFPHIILEWNKLDMQIRRSESFLSFENSLLNIDRPTAKPTYNLHNSIGLKYLTRLRLGLNHFKEHKFKQDFQDWVNPLCSCSLEIESLSDYFLHYHHFTNIRATYISCSQLIEISQVFHTMN